MMTNVNHASLLEVQSATSARLDAELTKSRALNTELLAALEALIAEYEPHMKAFADNAPRKALWKAASAAIAKAKGE